MSKHHSQKHPILDIYLYPGTVNIVCGSGESLYSNLAIQLVRDVTRAMPGSPGEFLDLKSLPDVDALIAILRRDASPGRLAIHREMECDAPCWVYGRDSPARRDILDGLSAFLATQWGRAGDPDAPDAPDAQDAPPPATARPRLLLIAYVSSLFPPNPNSYVEVAALVRDLRQLAEAFNCAMLLEVPASKSAKRYEYEPRDRIVGSSAWSDECDTILVVDFEGQAANRTSSLQRRLHITRHNRTTRSYPLEWMQDGSGFRWTNPPSGELTMFEKLYYELMAVPENVPIPRKRLFTDINRYVDASTTTLKRWLDHALETGRLYRADQRGCYAKPADRVQ